MFPQIFISILNGIINVLTNVRDRIRGTATLPGWEWWMDETSFQEVKPVHSLIRDFMKTQGIRAGTCTIRIAGRVELNAGYNWGPPGTQEILRDFVFRIAGCTKFFTDAAILKLKSQGKLTGEEFVFDFIGIKSQEPAPPDDRVNQIRIRNLVAHTAGWNFAGSNDDPVFNLSKVVDEFSLTEAPTKQDFARYMYHQPVAFNPGDLTFFSNIGYVLLGLVIEAASGMSYIEYLRSEILAPEGIDDVFVAATRPGGRRDNEPIYEDPAMGRDVTRPADLSIVPYPYGGNDAMTEVMDASAGLATSTGSLVKFIGRHNTSVATINDDDVRTDNLRTGSMAGSFCLAESFRFETKDRQLLEVEWALVFNRFRFGTKTGDIADIEFGRLGREIKRLIMDR